MWLFIHAGIKTPLLHFILHTRVTLYTAGHLHTAVPHCSHSRAPIVHTAVPRENNEHGCVYLRCRAVCKLPGCVEGHPCTYNAAHSLNTMTCNINETSMTVIWENNKFCLSTHGGWSKMAHILQMTFCKCIFLIRNFRTLIQNSLIFVQKGELSLFYKSVWRH